ncbi:hypothetical protein [Planctomicrobium piriforme]|uniref:Uncharacterized protein n=1 Tax=Planctomicrobium piriforme TaxID=1576369 RepID=A0A1I3F2H1_9PLAN|nr:hypothetical protein [Planctomicrobium piriforme]SFI05439.1 hypothetical protein SAMN05421753_10555 [Planctomicrobium piriforme]
MDDEFQLQSGEEDRFDLLPANVPLLPLPEYCYSLETGKPFRFCIDCDEPLLLQKSEPLVPESPDNSHYALRMYGITKVIVGGEAVFELALCLRCNDRLVQRFSQESRAAIAEFIGSALHIPGPERIQSGDFSCFHCRRPKSSCHRYTIGMFCAGKHICANAPHVMICDACESEMAECLSKHTREEWDRFIEEHFDPTPGLGLDEPHRFPMII